MSENKILSHNSKKDFLKNPVEHIDITSFDSRKIISKKLTSFDFFGPTCDSMDYMKGPFILPNNIKENDYIELGQLGAYGLTFRTKFNGFYSNDIYEVEDDPIMSMYDKETKKVFLVA